MSIFLGSGGWKSLEFPIHGVAKAMMLVVGLLVIHAIGEKCL
jgi:hypothetical protein